MYKAVNHLTNRVEVVGHSVGLGLRGEIILPKAGVVKEVDRSQLSFLEMLGL